MKDKNHKNNHHIAPGLLCRTGKMAVLSACISIVFASSGCEKLIEVDPPIQVIVGQEIYGTNAGAASVLNGLYITLSEYGTFVHGASGLSAGLALSADELTLFDGSTDQNLIRLFQNSGENSLGNSLWISLYQYNFHTNAAIEGIQASDNISDNVRNQLLGEAYFLRAFFHFYLTSLYGDIPLILSTDSKISSVAPRVEKVQVYNQIIKDLTESKNLLNPYYVAADAISETTERVRPNRHTASALLARVYLYMGEWDKAIEEASAVINNGMYGLTSLDQTFLKNSKETIWAFQTRDNAINNGDGIFFNFIDTDNGPFDARPVYLSNQLYNSFENNDNRRTAWIKTKTWLTQTYPYANKYKTDITSTDITEYQIVFRLAELYLIRAEAYAQQGKFAGPNSAAEDLNKIRKRAGLSGTSASSKEDIINAILQERQNELFTEWGHRWFDLQRLNKIDQVMNQVASSKGATWASFKALFPLPVFDLTNNPNLRGHQNPGYSEQ